MSIERKTKKELIVLLNEAQATSISSYGSRIYKELVVLRDDLSRAILNTYKLGQSLRVITRKNFT